MTNPTNFRADQARRMAELIQQARTLDEQTKTQEALGGGDVSPSPTTLKGKQSGRTGRST